MVIIVDPIYICTGDIIFDLMLDIELGPRVVNSLAWENPMNRDPADVFHYWRMSALGAMR